MDMIRYAARSETFTASVAGDGSQIGIEFRPHAGVHQSAAILGAEDDMDNYEA